MFLSNFGLEFCFDFVLCIAVFCASHRGVRARSVSKDSARRWANYRSGGSSAGIRSKADGQSRR